MGICQVRNHNQDFSSCTSGRMQLWVAAAAAASHPPPCSHPTGWGVHWSIQLVLNSSPLVVPTSSHSPPLGITVNTTVRAGATPLRRVRECWIMSCIDGLCARPWEASSAAWSIADRCQRSATKKGAIDRSGISPNRFLQNIYTATMCFLSCSKLLTLFNSYRQMYQNEKTAWSKTTEKLRGSVRSHNWGAG